jgi:hypothetical protein
VRWDGMMDRLKVQRDDVVHDLEELGPLPDLDPQHPPCEVQRRSVGRHTASAAPQAPPGRSYQSHCRQRS